MAEAPKELLASIEKGAALKHVDAPEDNPALAQAKIDAAIKKGSFDLKHVNAPEESPALAQAKIEAAIKKGSFDLNHVPAPVAGPSDAVKAAFVEDRKKA